MKVAVSAFLDCAPRSLPNEVEFLVHFAFLKNVGEQRSGASVPRNFHGKPQASQTKRFWLGHHLNDPLSARRAGDLLSETLSYQRDCGTNSPSHASLH